MCLFLFLCIGLTILINVDGIILNKEYVQGQWNLFKNGFQRNYLTEFDEFYRYKIFEDNLNYIEEHNVQYKQGLVSFDMEINQFSDRLHSEFLNEISCYINDTMIDDSEDILQRTIYIPESFQVSSRKDWSTKGAVTPVKQQGKCGSCWAFASTGALEAAHWRQHKQLISLSEQNLIDCSKKFGTSGCHGGWMTDAYKYIHENKGIDTSDSYPYIAKEGECQFKESQIGARVRFINNLPKGNEGNMLRVLSSIGPVAVAIDASQKSFQSYKSGVYYEANCNSGDNANHAVLIVGYGTLRGQAYWKVKNSWGVGWGNKGYILMARNRENNCCIASFAVYPTAA